MGIYRKKSQKDRVLSRIIDTGFENGEIDPIAEKTCAHWNWNEKRWEREESVSCKDIDLPTVSLAVQDPVQISDSQNCRIILLVTFKGNFVII